MDNKYSVLKICTSIVFSANTFGSNNNLNLNKEDTESSTKVVRTVANKIGKFFDLFYNFDICVRISRLESVYPFIFAKDGSVTFRLSFCRIFKKNNLLRHNLVLELNFFKARDLGGRGLDYIERKFGSNILLDNWDENTESKQFANGAYFFSHLNKAAFFISIGFEGNGIYNKIFKTNFIKSGFGLRFPLWCGGPFTLVKDLNLDFTNTNYNKESGCNKWKNLGSKHPLQGILFNVILYIKPFIYEFDNGFRIDLTWETSINDYRYVFYKIKKSRNASKNISVFNIADKGKSVNCFRKFLIVLENIFVLKTKFEIGINLSKFV